MRVPQLMFLPHSGILCVLSELTHIAKWIIYLFFLNCFEIGSVPTHHSDDERANLVLLRHLWFITRWQSIHNEIPKQFQDLFLYNSTISGLIIAAEILVIFFFLYCRPPLWQQFTDFANVLKAFIGTSYLSLPFAFYQSGLVVCIL